MGILSGQPMANKQKNISLAYRGSLLIGFVIFLLLCPEACWPTLAHPIIFLWFLAMSAIVLDLFVIEIKYLRVNLVLGVFFSVFLLYGPYIAGFLAFTTMFISSWISERFIKGTNDYGLVIFNSSMMGLVILLSSHLYLFFGGTEGQLVESDFWPAFWSFGVINFILNTALVALDISLEGRGVLEAHFLEGLSWEFASYVISFVMVKLLTDVYLQEGLFSGMLFLVVIISLNYLTGATKRVSKVNQQLKELLNSSEIILREGDLASKISTALKGLRNVMPHTLAMVYICDDGGHLKPIAYQGPKLQSLDELHSCLGEHKILSQVITTGKAYIIKDSLKETKCISEADLAAYIRSVMLVPIGVGKKNFGVIVICDDMAGAFGPKEKEIITLLANQLALAVENDHVYRCLEEEAMTDSLTGLYNQRYFRQALEKILNQSSKVSLIILDVDFFKKLNDTYGHLVGDQVLRQMGAVLKQSIREGDVAARYGGEEFVLILPETSLDSAYQIAERIRINVMRQVLIVEGQKIKLTISGGVSEYPRLAKSPEELLKQADEALYEQAKLRDRNHVGVYGKG